MSVITPGIKLCACDITIVARQERSPKNSRSGSGVSRIQSISAWAVNSDWVEAVGSYDW